MYQLTQRLQGACTEGLTYYFVHPKRGKEVTDEMNVLLQFAGKVVHGSWVKDLNWVAKTRRWSPAMVSALEKFLKIQ